MATTRNRKNAFYAQSGGVTAVINASACGVIETARAHKDVIGTVYAGRAAADFFGVPGGDPRPPDVLGLVQHGVVYTGGTGKIAEHGGADPQDRDVPILVTGPDVHHAVVDHAVETTQIAPTILDLLGLDPHALRAVQIEHTKDLPGIER